MPITFRAEIRGSSFLDPFARFEEKERRVQLREDPLTGAISRVFSYRRRPPQSDQGNVKAGNVPEVCAFCSENIETMTPMFPPALCPEGRLVRGEATAFPNIFPYDTHNAVVAITHQHEVGMAEWCPERLADAFLVCREYINRVAEREGGAWFYSVNWNYTPVAGASQIHPHLQIIISRKPTLEQERLIEGSRKYMEDNSTNYWEELVRIEEEKGERFLGRTGNIPWLVNFAPRGFVPDVTAVITNLTDFTCCDEYTVEYLAQGLVKLFTYYGGRRIAGVNLSLYSQSPGADHFRTHVRIVPRLRIPPLNISDVNYFKLMHDEAISLLPPERVCEELRPFFQE